MPFLTTDKNFEKVARSLVQEGESLKQFFGGGRRVVFLTDRRLVVSNFPFFGAAKPLIDAPIQEIQGMDAAQVSATEMELTVTAGGTDQRVKLQTVLGDVPARVSNLKETILAANPSAGGASYFEPGEQGVASLPTKDGVLRVSDRTLYLVAKKPNADGSANIQMRVPLGAIQAFDYHQSKMGSVKIRVVAGGEERLLTVPGSVSDMTSVETRGLVAEGRWEPAQMAAVIAAASPQARPDYLGPNETVLFSVRAGTGALGAVNANSVLRLTDLRLIQLTPDKSGKLSIKWALDRPVGAVTSTRHKGDHGNVTHYTLALDDHGQKFAVPVENDVAYKKLLDAL